MKIITLYLPEQYVNCVDTLRNLGYFPSRSEAIRQILKEFFDREQTLVNELTAEHFANLKYWEFQELEMYK